MSMHTACISEPTNRFTNVKHATALLNDIKISSKRAICMKGFIIMNK